MLLQFPEILNINDLGLMADWLEAAILASDTGELSNTRMRDLLSESGLVPTSRREALADDITADDVDVMAAEDKLSDYVDQLWQAVEQRQRAFGNAYPFEQSRERVVLRPGIRSWRDAPCYFGMLIWDLSQKYRSFRPSETAEFRTLFEHIVAASLEGLFCGKSVRFPCRGDDGWPRDIRARVERLAEEFDLSLQNLEAALDPEDKDIGLDVLARVRIADERPGALYILTQCATGQNWWDKRGEPMPERWFKTLYWDGIFVAGLAIPWRLNDGKLLLRSCENARAIVFDRSRLVGGHPDKFIKPAAKERLLDWCSKQTPLLPSFT